VVQLREHIVELGFLAAHAAQGELCLRLGEPQNWSLGTERRKPYGYSWYFCWCWVVRSPHCSFSGSPIPILWLASSQFTVGGSHRRLNYWISNWLAHRYYAKGSRYLETKSWDCSFILLCTPSLWQVKKVLI
jgi:hypothetical protein